jgi:hypothetical protein
VEASFAAKQMRQRLSTVIAHSKVTLITVDTDRRVSMFEGALGRDVLGGDRADLEYQRRSSEFIGQDISDVLSQLDLDVTEEQKLDFLQPLDEVLSGNINRGQKEHKIRECHIPGLERVCNPAY